MSASLRFRLRRFLLGPSRREQRLAAAVAGLLDALKRDIRGDKEGYEEHLGRARKDLLKYLDLAYPIGKRRSLAQE